MSHRRVWICLKLPFLCCAWDYSFSSLDLQLCICCSGYCLCSLVSSVMCMQNLLMVPTLDLSSAVTICPADTDAIYVVVTQLSFLCSVPSSSQKVSLGAQRVAIGWLGVNAAFYCPQGLLFVPLLWWDICLSCCCCPKAKCSWLNVVG